MEYEYYSISLREPGGILDIEPTITGRPGTALGDDHVVVIVERRWLNTFRKHIKSQVVGERYHLIRITAERDGAECWERTHFQMNTYRYDLEVKEQAWEDWEYRIPYGLYADWVNQHGDTHIPTSPGDRPADGIHKLPKISVPDLDDRTFAGKLIASDWAVDSEMPEGALVLVKEGTPQYQDGPREPCPPPPPPPPPQTLTGPPSAVAIVEVIDIDSEPQAPVSGATVTVSGFSDGPVAKGTDQKGGLPVGGAAGAQITIVHVPPPGWVCVRNSKNQEPPGTMRVSLEDDLHYIFYDRRIRTREEPGSGTTDPEDGLPPPPWPRSLRRPLPWPGLPWWLPFGLGGFIFLIAMGAVVLYLLRPSQLTSQPPAGRPPAVSAIKAQFVPAERATHYSVTVTDPGGDTFTYAWSHVPPADDPGCSAFMAGSPANTAVWHHADEDGCHHDKEIPNVGHAGTITVVVSSARWTCTETYRGTVDSLPDARPNPCVRG